MFGGSDLAASGKQPGPICGCGDGGFTLALAEVIAPGSLIHALDRDVRALGRLAAHHKKVRVRTHHGDFTKQPWSFTDLDGILMANSLHYIKLQEAFIHRCQLRLRPHHRFLIVVPTPIQRILGFVPRLVVPHLRRSSSWQGMRRSRCSARAPRRIIARSSTRR